MIYVQGRVVDVAKREVRPSQGDPFMKTLVWIQQGRTMIMATLGRDWPLDQIPVVDQEVTAQIAARAYRKKDGGTEIDWTLIQPAHGDQGRASRSAAGA